jgi:hypothetical protein
MIFWSYPSPPIPAKKWFVFMGIELVSSCNSLIRMEFFADMPFQRGCGHFLGQPLVFEEDAGMIVRQ